MRTLPRETAWPRHTCSPTPSITPEPSNGVCAARCAWRVHTPSTPSAHAVSVHSPWSTPSTSSRPVGPEPALSQSWAVSPARPASAVAQWHKIAASATCQPRATSQRRRRGDDRGRATPGERRVAFTAGAWPVGVCVAMPGCHLHSGQLCSDAVEARVHVVARLRAVRSRPQRQRAARRRSDGRRATWRMPRGACHMARSVPF